MVILKILNLVDVKGDPKEFIEDLLAGDPATILALIFTLVLVGFLVFLNFMYLRWKKRTRERRER